MNKIKTGVFLMGALTLQACAAVDNIHVIPCPKCDKRMRIIESGKEANINISRLSDDSPDEETLAKRLEAMRERAKRFLAIANKSVSNNRAAPLMGWSTWNTFAVNISQSLIGEVAEKMVSSGLKDAGYVYVNIDDGFFCGHDAQSGKLKIHPERFPNGLKCVVDHIHSLGMKAGIYSDAGVDTCGSKYNEDELGAGSGLYGHDKDDCEFYFRDCDFDFIKVDYCGGSWMNLDEKTRYEEIARAIKAAAPDKEVRFNICRWKYPGTWAGEIADSWRTTRDIRASWKIVRQIIDENLYLSAFASPGHYNDMDMLEVGQIAGKTKTSFTSLSDGDKGLTREEERTHFGMWCMLSSPLLLGCDVRTMDEESLRLVTNPFLIEMNQNGGLGVQGYVVKRKGDAYILTKDAFERFGKSRYVALYNAADEQVELEIAARDLDLGGRIQVFDLVEMADVGEFTISAAVKIPPHGAKFYLFDAESRLEREVYEAECAYLKAYQELHDAVKSKTAYRVQNEKASGGVVVAGLGHSETNDLVWKDVNIFSSGKRKLEFRVFASSARRFLVDIDGALAAQFDVGSSSEVQSFELEAELEEGLHSIRLYNNESAAPDIDSLVIR